MQRLFSRLVNTIGGSGFKATVFFNLHRSNVHAGSCPFGAFQWIVDNLRPPEDALTGLDQAVGFLTTPAKRATGVRNWGATGCHAPRVVGRVLRSAFSTDGFWTIDVYVDEIAGRLLFGSNKAVRIEVDPMRSDGPVPLNPASESLLVLGPPHDGERIIFSGDVLIDHGSFLEVHPTTPIEKAASCASIPPGTPPPLYCNTVLADSFIWARQLPPTPMGRGGNRACFLTSIQGPLNGGSPNEIHALLDPTTNNWFLTGQGPLLAGRATAKCMAVRSLSDEHTWSSGDPPARLDVFEDNRGCFLTRVAGAFDSAGDTVSNDNLVGSPQALSLHGASTSAGISASARCITTTLVTEPDPWSQGTATITLALVSASPGCFFTFFQGGFDLNDDSVDILSALDTTGQLRWTLGGHTSHQGGIMAAASCVFCP